MDFRAISLTRLTVSAILKTRAVPRLHVYAVIVPFVRSSEAEIGPVFTGRTGGIGTNRGTSMDPLGLVFRDVLKHPSP